jgi:hypothetical protein
LLLRAPGTNQASLSLFKSFSLSALREGARLEIRAESFNALNHPVFNPPASVVNTASFGVISSERSMLRQVQLVLKAYF